MVIIILLVSTLVLAGVLYVPEPIIEIKETPPVKNDEEMWIPTKEDIAYQDSMYTIIQNTQSDLDTIKLQVKQIIERLNHYDK